MSKPPKLLDLVRNEIRVRHYSLRTEKAYVGWIKRYIFFHRKKHPKLLGESEIRQFLTFLAVKQNVAASTQNQAFAALLFLYREVLKIELSGIDAVRAKGPKRLPVVLTPAEAFRIIDIVRGTNRIVVGLLYGSGLRITECQRLRIKDLDFGLNEIYVRDAKGKKGRVTMLPLC